MTVKEIEELLPITRANIRFYEKEGLLAPERKENGYRNYDENDIARLKEIILFRKLGISIPDIKRILAGDLELSKALEDNVAALNEQLEEIKAAKELCMQMLKDDSVDTDFRMEQYWELMQQREQNGGKFADYVRDYIEMEGNAFLAMWDSVFLANFQELKQKKGWKILFLAVLFVCIVRGLAVSLLWKTGSFFYGFCYPFALFGVITVITLPLYILNTVYGEKEGGKNEREVKPHNLVIAILLELVAAIVGVLFIVLAPLILEDSIVPYLTGVTNNYILINDLTLLYLAVAFYFFAVLVWLFRPIGLFANRFDGEAGFVCRLPRRIKGIVLLASFMVYVLGFIVYAGFYGCSSSEKLQISKFYIREDYEWEDVCRVSIRASMHGMPIYTLHLKNGKSLKLMGDMVESTCFDESQFPDEENDFILERTAWLAKNGVYFDVNWDKVYKDIGYDYWKDYLRKLQDTVTLNTTQ